MRTRPPQGAAAAEAPADAWALLALPVLAAIGGVLTRGGAWPAVDTLGLVAGPLLLIVLLRLGEGASRSTFAALAAIALAVSAAAGDGPILAAALATSLPPGLALLTSRFRGLALTAALVGVASLVALDSRGGLLAGLAGLAAFAGLSARRRGRAVTVGALVAGAAGALASLLEVAGEPLWRRWLLEDQGEGLSLSSALTGRVEIWRRALWMIADAWPYPLGPGAFGPVLAAAYPGAPPVDHAHSLALQIAAALGPAGLVLALWLLARSALALGRASRAAADRSERLRTAGLAGGLVAFLSFGLAEVPPPPTSLLPWPLLALALPRRPEGAPSPTRRLTAAAAALVLLLPALLAALWAPPVVLRLGELTAPRGTFRGPASSSDWLEGLAAHRAGEPERRRLTWSRLVERSPRRLALLAEVADGSRPGDRALARAAVRRWPDAAEAWRWAARVARDRDETIAALSRVVERAPRDGRAWLALGDQLATADPSRALEAYALACVHGDPGANACLRGGRHAELHGAPLRAGALYRRSRWGPVRARAGSLEVDSGSRP